MSDHAGYASQYTKAGIPVYSAFETQKAVEIITGELTRAIPPMKSCKVGNFTVVPFNVPHDADIECYGYLVEHEEIGKLLFMTDLEYCKYDFSSWNLNHIICEANYCKEYIDMDDAKYKHVLTGHMSIETACNFLKANNNPALRTVTLCHLSAQNADSDNFKNRAEQVVDVPVEIARKGLEVDLSLCPF